MSDNIIESLDEFIIKAIVALRKNKKRPDEARIYKVLDVFIEGCVVSDSLFWERMKHLEEIGHIYNKPTKNGSSFHVSENLNSSMNDVSKTDTTSPAIDPTPKPNTQLTPNSLDGNISIISNGIENLEKFIDQTLADITQKKSSMINIRKEIEKSKKIEEQPNSKDILISSMTDTISFLKLELNNKQTTIDSLLTIIKELTFKSRKTNETMQEDKSQQTDFVNSNVIEISNEEKISEPLSEELQSSQPCNSSPINNTENDHKEDINQNDRLLRELQEQIDIQKKELEALQQQKSTRKQTQDKDHHVSQDKDNNIIIYGDSIPKGINRNMLNRKLLNAKCFYKFFPGATSRDFYHYIKPALLNPEMEYNLAILHMGINDILNLDSNAETVANSIMNIASQCKTHGVKDVIVSSITFTSLLSIDFLQSVNEEIKRKCEENGYYFIDNNNITKKHLWQDGLHLTNNGKGILLDNFCKFLNDNNFLKKPLSGQIPS